MAPRRPSTADEAGPSRIPFAAAEALLWGPEMKKQHAYLLTEMRALQKQHDGYDVRIQATEAVMAASEAATARIRHLEQQIAAIEAEDDDKAFEKWASGEMTRLGIFVDTNKNVRQKQIELDREVSQISENLGKLERIPKDLKTILRRLDNLEHGQRDDAHRIRSLEGEIEHLRSQQTTAPLRFGNTRLEQKPRQDHTRALRPPQLRDADISDATTETDDEGMLSSHLPLFADLQVPKSPDTRQVGLVNILATSPTKSRSVISARKRLLQRPSIHNSMLTPSTEDQNPHRTLVNEAIPNSRRVSPPATQLVNRECRHIVPAPGPEREARPQHTNKAPSNKTPATQLVDRPAPKKRKQPDPEPQTQRQTRSQAKRIQANDVKPQVKPVSDAAQGIEAAPIIEPISSPRKKLKITPLEPPARKKAGSNTTSQTASKNIKRVQKQPAKPKMAASTQLETTTTRSKRMQATTPRNKDAVPFPSRPCITNPKAQRRLIVKLPLPKRPAHLGPRNINNSQVNAADRVKMSPRKAAAGSKSPFKILSKPVSARNKHHQNEQGNGTSRHIGKLNAIEDDPGSSSRTVSPEKARPLARVRSPTASNVSTAGRRRRRAISDIKDFDTFKRLQEAGALE